VLPEQRLSLPVLSLLSIYAVVGEYPVVLVALLQTVVTLVHHVVADGVVAVAAADVLHDAVT